MTNWIKRLWQTIVFIFEKADIVPPIIAVSIVHYGVALAEKENVIFVAYVIGGLVDIGHYRSVKSYFKKNEVKRFILMLVFTGLTGWYHYLYYQDIALALAMPVLIIGLALLSTWEGWENQGKEKKVKVAKEDSGKLPEVSENVRKDWRTLPEIDRKRVATMRTPEIVSEFGVSDRTARNWRQQINENGNGNGHN